MRRRLRLDARLLGLAPFMLGILAGCLPGPTRTAATSAPLPLPEPTSTNLPSPTATSPPSLASSTVPTAETTSAELRLLGELEVGMANTAIGRQKLVSDVAWAPDGTQLAVAAFDVTTGTIELLDLKTLDRLWSAETALTFDIEFSPDGNILAANFPTPGVILTWDVASGDRVLEVESGYLDPCLVGEHLEFLPDRGRIVTGYDLGKGPYETTIDLWDLQSGQCEGALLRTDGGLVSLWVEPSGQYMILTLLKVQEDPSKRVSIWNLETLEPTCSAPGNIGALAGNGRALAIVGPDERSIELRRVPDCQLIRAVAVDFDVFSLALSPDASLLAVGGAGLEIWDLSSLSKLAHVEDVPSAVTVLAFSPDGSMLISTGSANPGEKTKILLWEFGS